MRKTKLIAIPIAVAALSLAILTNNPTPVAAGGPDSGYRVLKPIQSGDLTLFPVVRADQKSAASSPFLTLDEGFKSGEVEVTEYGKVRGLVRSRGGVATNRYQGDQVNTLVLVNNSKRPLLLLAGEIVTGGKQDRIIAKDRIVPVGADPIDLSVFCVEHGRWTESSGKFGATASNEAKSFMVQPAVRQQAMVAKDQQQVWNAVGGAISDMAIAAAPKAAPVTPRSGTAMTSEIVTVDSMSNLPLDNRAVHGTVAPLSMPTTSYAKAMQMGAVSAVVDRQSEGLLQSREAALATLRQEHAIGVVVAVRGEIIWADLFSDPELLSRYWVKLVRSYAAEGLAGGTSHGTASIANAQAFLDTQPQGHESTEGEVGVYRNREIKSNGTDLFALESLLPGTGYDVHISKLKLKGQQAALGIAPPRF